MSEGPMRSGEIITTRQIGLIHTAKAAVGLREEEYRDLLGSFGAASSRELTVRQFEQVMAHFAKLGFRYRGRARVEKGPVISDQAAEKQRLLGGIETRLAALGYSWRYADSIARRMYRVEKVQWCNPEQIQAVLTAIDKNMRKTAGSKK